MSAVTAEKPKTGGWLGAVERIGNKVPHPVLMFLYLIIGVIVLSAVMDALGVSVTEQIAIPITNGVETDFYADTTEPLEAFPTEP
jgi:aminobenzoyl-glutamate transport protein